MFILARFYSCMHTTIELWMRGGLGDAQDSRSASRRLEKMRHAMFREEMGLLNSLRTLSHFSSFEPPVGGKFPRKVYDGIIGEVQRMLVCMALMARVAQGIEAPTSTHTSPATTNTNTMPTNESKLEAPWATRLASIALESTTFKSHSITSLLCHFSSSITNAQPLPPFLSAGDTFPLARRLQEVDGGLLSLRHVEDPAFSAFVAMEVLRSVVGHELGGLLRYVISPILSGALFVSLGSGICLLTALLSYRNVRELVGEISFDFHVRPGSGMDEAERRRLMDGDE
jgi:hypothetical protein